MDIDVRIVFHARYLIRINGVHAAFYWPTTLLIGLI